MEEDLEEEQMNYESAVEKSRKAQEQLDQLSAEISQYQSNIFKLENSKSQLEKQARSDLGPLVVKSSFVLLCPSTSR